MIKAFFEVYKILNKIGIKPKDVIGMGGNIVKMGKSLFNTRINPKLLEYIAKNQKIPAKILENIKLHARTLKNTTQNQKNLFLENMKSIQKAKTPIKIPKSKPPVTSVQKPGLSVKEQGLEAFKGWKPTVIKGGKDKLATGGIANHFRKKFNKGELVDEVNMLMEKTPFFNKEDYDKVRYENPDGKFAVENWGKGEAPLAEATEDGEIISYMGEFVEGETEKNLDKAKVLAHEKLHLLWEDPEVVKTLPPWVQEQLLKAEELWKVYETTGEESDYRAFMELSSGIPLDWDKPSTGGGDTTGEELYTRYMENKYFPKTESDVGPWGDRVYFDKILKDHWDPYAEKFDTLMKSRKAHGGRAKFDQGSDDKGVTLSPILDISKTISQPVEGIEVDESDTTYGIEGIYQGDNLYAGGEYIKGKVKVNVQENGNTVFEDSMSKDDLMQLYVGLGEKEGNHVEIGTDGQGSYTLNIFKTFVKGGIANHFRNK